MKKFIIRAVCVLVLCFLLMKCTEIFYKNFIDKDEVTKFYNIPFSIELANLGSSHGQCSFNYSELEQYDTFNFALNGQTLEYDYRILKEYIRRMDKGSILIVPVSYVSFFLADTELEEDDFEIKNKRYYSILRYSNIIKADLSTYVKLKYFPLFYSNMRMDIVNYINSKLLNNENSEADTVSKGTTTKEEAAADAIAAYGRHVEDYYIDGEYRFNDKLIQILYDIISLCKEKDIQPILVTTPFLKEYNDLVSEDFLVEFHGIVDKISEETNTVYYDYSNDERFVERYELFFNSDHLNDEGAVIFTGIFYEECLKSLMED